MSENVDAIVLVDRFRDACRDMDRLSWRDASYEARARAWSDAREALLQWMFAHVPAAPDVPDDDEIPPLGEPDYSVLCVRCGQPSAIRGGEHHPPPGGAYHEQCNRCLDHRFVMPRVSGHPAAPAAPGDGAFPATVMCECGCLGPCTEHHGLTVIVDGGGADRASGNQSPAARSTTEQGGGR